METQTIELSRAQLELVQFVEDDDYRGLNRLRIAGGFIEATNGHAIARCEYHLAAEDVSVHVDVARAALKMLGRRTKANADVKATIRIKDGHEYTIKVGDTSTTMDRDCYGDYPKTKFVWDQVPDDVFDFVDTGSNSKAREIEPGHTPVTRVGLNFKYLGLIHNYMTKIGNKRTDTINARFVIRGGLECVFMDFKHLPDCEYPAGLQIGLMPCRL